MATMAATFAPSLSSNPRTSFFESSQSRRLQPIKSTPHNHNHLSVSMSAAASPPYDLKSFKFDPIKESIVSREMTRRYMMDMITYADTDVVVVGAGSAGLSCAYELSKNPSVQFTIDYRMEELFVAVLSMLLLVAMIPLYLWKRRQSSQSPNHTEEEEVQVPQREAVVRATGTRRMRRRPASAASTSSAPLEEEIVEGSDDEAAEGDYYNAKASKKKEKKRQEREAQRQAEEASRDSRHTKQDRYAEMRRRKDEEREALERQQEEEALARKAKEEEAAALEFEKWKGDFSVDAEGTTENEVQDGSQGLLFDFVEYIKKHKCIPLEDLAAEFKLRTQDCINRINSLENMGRLSGVMDDRGKYIYISLEEMQAVADYIKRQGRVSISHLASKSNQFIDLEPKAQFVEEISSVEEITAA